MIKLFTLASLLVTMPVSFISVNYNYSYYGETIHSAPGMTFAAYINAQSLGVTLTSPEDLVVYDEEIYLVDSNTNNLIVIDNGFNLVKEYVSFSLSTEYQDYLTDQGVVDFSDISLDSPHGIDVNDSGIYICDTSNFRIVKLNHDFEVIATFQDMDDKTFDLELDDGIEFEPMKITVDASERMYVVAKGVYEGIMEINYDGDFNRFTGVNPIVLTPFEIFSRSLMTEEQIAQLQLFLPTEYTNVSINEKSFIYATSKTSENNADNPIQLINPKGVDVITRNGYFPPKGDIHYVIGSNNYVIEGPSELVDISSTDHGIYTVLDQKRSRLFTYDSEGNLLYINGDEGSQSDKFSEGVAIEYFNDDLLILDRGTKTIVVYQLTEFGAYVNQAISYHDEGKFEEAALIWEEVVKINSNYEIAFNGIGKLLLRQENYKEAMEYFKLGHDTYYYSKAFKGYRNDIIKNNFGLIIGSMVVVAGGLMGYKVYSTYKKGGSILYED